MVECDKCYRSCEGYYTLSHLSKGLWVKCPNCGTHARPFIDNLPIPSKPSKAYLKMLKAGGV